MNGWSWSIAVAVFQLAAALGAGSLVLRLTGVGFLLAPWERRAWALGLGTGALGWLLFFLGWGGWLAPLPVGLLLGVCLVGWRWLGRPPAFRSTTWTRWETLLAILLALVLGLGLLEGFCPPTEGDTLAYHFDLPKQFVAHGGLLFVPRAVDGATPLLIHMTYAGALSLGGERALTLWSVIGDWGSLALVYAVARRFLDRAWALAVTLAFLTTPGLIYALGPGLVEPQTAAFATAAFFAVAEARRTGRVEWVILAGIAAGFFAGAKYTGLLAVAVCGIGVLFDRRFFRNALVFGVAALAAGWQWYAWNWSQSGDPMFPLLYGLLGAKPGLWSAEVDHALRVEWPKEESPLPRSLWTLLTYPFRVTFAPLPEFDAGRIGFGPLAFLLLPFAILGGLRTPRPSLRGPLATLGGLAMALCLLWFYLGTSQRLRHYLPVYPTVLIGLVAAARRSPEAPPATDPPLAAGLTLVLVLQLAGQSVYSSRFVTHFLAGEEREAFVERQVSGYPVAVWVNRHLGPGDRLMTIPRHLNYYFDIPHLYTHPAFQAQVTITDDSTDVDRFRADLHRQGITHILVGGDVRQPGPASGYGFLIGSLYRTGCARIVLDFSGPYIGSRALGDSGLRLQYQVLEVKGCLSG